MSTIQAISSHFTQPQAPSPTQDAAAPGTTSQGPSLFRPTEADTARVEISTISRVQSERDAAISLGGRARSADATFERALELVKGMKEQLTNITKQFPPYATDNSERIQFLNGFSGLKAQVQSLTFPSDPEATGEWTQVKFPPERIDWEIPELDPTSASDEAIRLAEDKLAQAETLILKDQQDLYDSVAGTSKDSAGDEQALMLSQQIKDRLAN